MFDQNYSLIRLQNQTCSFVMLFDLYFLTQEGHHVSQDIVWIKLPFDQKNTQLIITIIICCATMSKTQPALACFLPNYWVKALLWRQCLCDMQIRVTLKFRFAGHTSTIWLTVTIINRFITLIITDESYNYYVIRIPAENTLSPCSLPINCLGKSLTLSSMLGFMCRQEWPWNADLADKHRS